MSGVMFCRVRLERELTDEIDCDDVMSEFAARKARKILL